MGERRYVLAGAMMYVEKTRLLEWRKAGGFLLRSGLHFIVLTAHIECVHVRYKMRHSCNNPRQQHSIYMLSSKLCCINTYFLGILCVDFLLFVEWDMLSVCLANDVNIYEEGFKR